MAQSTAASQPTQHLWLQLIEDVPERARLQAEFDGLLDRAVQGQACDDDQLHDELVGEYSGLLVRVFQELDDRALGRMTSTLQAELDAAVRRELEGIDAAAVLASRQLQSALDVLARLVELERRLLHGLRIPSEIIARAMSQEIDAQERNSVLGLALDISVALKLVHGDPATLARWCARARTVAQHVDAWLITNGPSVRAVRARLKARLSWVDWDEEEIEHEARPWKPTTASP